MANLDLKMLNLEDYRSKIKKIDSKMSVYFYLKIFYIINLFHQIFDLIVVKLYR